jgi:hypothetical protein
MIRSRFNPSRKRKKREEIKDGRVAIMCCLFGNTHHRKKERKKIKKRGRVW